MASWPRRLALLCATSGTILPREVARRPGLGDCSKKMLESRFKARKAFLLGTSASWADIMSAAHLLASIRKRQGSHPIRGPWLGLPRTFGLATVMGEPYLELLPSFAGGAEVSDGLAFRSLETWRGGGDITSLTGPPHPKLCPPDETRWVEQTHRLSDGSELRVGTREAPRTRAAHWPFPSMPSSSS